MKLGIIRILYCTFLLYMTIVEPTISYKSRNRHKIFGSFKALSKAQVKSKQPYYNSDSSLQQSLRAQRNTQGTPYDLIADRPLTTKELGFTPKDMMKEETVHGTRIVDNDHKKGGDNNIDFKSPVKYQGWVKFFKYPSAKVNASSSKGFFINTQFKVQNRDKNIASQRLNTDGQGVYLYIPNELSFYATIYEGMMTFSTSRKNFLQDGYDVLRFELIKPIPDMPGYKGGLTDFGNFKEGHCMKITTQQSGSWTWVICTEQETDKQMIMKTIKQMKVSSQLGQYTTNTAQKSAMMHLQAERYKLHRENEETQGMTLNGKTNSVGGTEGMNTNLDGYWIVLQEWSTCTKACGGGTQTLQRMCIPPKKGGKPCEGEALVRKECNTEPCNDMINMVGSSTNNTVKAQIKEPTLHVLPFSDRPQRFEKCVVKEADLLMTEELDSKKFQMSFDDQMSGQLGQKIQIPVRVVMNLETLTAYSGLEEKDLKASFNMKNAKFLRSNRDKSCFVIKEVGRWKHESGNTSTDEKKDRIFESEFCPFGVGSSQEVESEWDYDFNLFKYQCHQSRQVKNFNGTDIEDDLTAKKNQLRLDIINKKKLKQKLEIPSDQGLVQSQKKNVLEALKKENRLERLIEKEMKEAQKEVLQMKAQEVEKEHCKLDALEKAIKTKEIENQFNVRKEKSAERLSKMAQEVKQRIEIKRNKLKEKLQKLKELTRKQVNGMDGQIQNIRLEIMNMETDGNYDPSKCEAMRKKPPSDFYKTRDQWCNEKFPANPEKLDECLKIREKKDLVNMCCNYETNINDMSAYDRCVDSQGDNNLDGQSTERRFWWDSKRYTDKLQTTDELKQAFDAARNTA